MLKFVFALLPALACAGCLQGDGNERINGPVNVAAGQPAADASTVNGSIKVAPGAAVLAAGTVNGSISLGEGASASQLGTVNGSIALGEQARVAGDVSTVNGDIKLARGADVTGSLRNVNGLFTIDAAHVGGDIKTVAGNIHVGTDSRIDGGIRIEHSTGMTVTIGEKIPVIVIAPGAVVAGPLKFDREVKLYVSDRATIGEVIGATPVMFSGDQPPTET
ncbi:MAG TPA: hypothetical protein PKL49_10630 [Steroidobacteraceae bacterium]|nr:hypothetical protein [Steroidobacteraceae bacterium]HNS28676.1 hypothetical protein [Steroidobacteraceae bacterium]